jgi:hypothetical protein
LPAESLDWLVDGNASTFGLLQRKERALWLLLFLVSVAFLVMFP